MQKTNRQAWLNAYRIYTAAIMLAVLAGVIALLMRPVPIEPPSVAEIQSAVTSQEFKRPGALEYVAKTDSYVTGGRVTYTQWKQRGEVIYDSRNDERLPKTELDDDIYTVFGFETDDGREITVSDNGQLYTEPNEDLGLELIGKSIDSKEFTMSRIIWGGK